MGATDAYTADGWEVEEVGGGESYFKDGIHVCMDYTHGYAK
jgi:hypothetical protein